jgi:cytochrome c5
MIRIKLLLISAAFACAAICLTGKVQMTEAGADDAAKARAAFNDASKVFFSPRCVNCHPAGDTPLIGDSSKQHEQGVKRGPEGKGVPGLECNTCHQEENLDGESLPPGAPNWQMPPAATKMSFQNVTAKQLCTQLKDPAQNGGKKTPKDAIHHIETDGRVHWAWAPGGGRTTPPMGFDEFVKKMNEWVASGAACPE